uniref:Rho-GAP domain-containing protein n=1 Tax=Trichobilharzia regenti TaxID=157069 RepID=A0AA85IWT5_TRIRE|nr:unnamed protein product [Trichobilharzia regenti]
MCVENVKWNICVKSFRNSYLFCRKIMTSKRTKRRKVRPICFQTLYDQIVCRTHKNSKGTLFSDSNLSHLLGALEACNKKWKSTILNLHSHVCIQKSEVKRLKSLQEHTEVMYRAEVEKRLCAEKLARSLERRLSVIRQVLLVNDIDSAKRQLDNMDLSLSALDESCNYNGQNEWSMEWNGISVGSSPVVRCHPTRGSKKFPRASSTGQVGIPRCSTTKQELRSSSMQKFFLQRSRERLSKSPKYTAQHLETINRLNRPHNFVSRTILRLETCSACARRITFAKMAYKCLICRLVVHPNCRQHLIQTCITPIAPHLAHTKTSRGAAMPSKPSAYIPLSPLTHCRSRCSMERVSGSPTAIRRKGSRNLSLSLLCPSNQFPQIPGLVIHCVNEVMARGMQTVGLYRVSGSEKQVRDLYEKFLRSRSTPSLALIDDIHVICCCLKLFLRSLEEPLVTYSQRSNLIAVSEEYITNVPKATESAVNVLKKLPTPNRHTLSFLMLHLKAVSNTPACQMSEENLSKVFGRRWLDILVQHLKLCKLLRKQNLSKMFYDYFSALRMISIYQSSQIGMKLLKLVKCKKTLLGQSPPI